MLIGLIADTHGVLRPEVIDAFAGVEQILHAGDVGSVEVLDGLAAIAPVTAVRGNVDAGLELPEVARLDLAGVHVLVVHGDRVGSPTPGKIERSGTMSQSGAARAIASSWPSVPSVNHGR